MKATEPELPVRGDRSPLRVLLVEDNDSDAMVAQAAVEKAVRGPLKIQRATTLKMSLAILESEPVDLVLLDLNLPDNRGVDTLRSMHVAAMCPIIVITAEDRPGLDDEALGSGAFEILHKGKLGTDTIARLLRLAEDRRRTQGSLEYAEHRFRSLTELSSDWYWEQDAELRFTYYSPGFAQRSGSTPEKNLGKRRWDEPGRAPLKGTWEEHRALLAAHKPFRDVEFVRLDKDGRRAFQSVTGEAFYDRAGKFAGYRGTSRDITERKLTEEALERTRTRLELALAASQVCTWDYDLASGEIVLSEAWAAIIGAPPGETRTTIQALVELVHPDDAASLRSAMTDTVKELRAEYSVEHRVRRRSGEWRWIVSRGKVVERDARGRALRVVGSNLDISERKSGEEALQEAKSFLQLVVDSSPNMIFVKDAQGKAIFVNRYLAQYYGTTPALILAKSTGEIHARAEEAHEYASDDQEVIRTRKSIIKDEPNTAPSGEQRWFQTIKVPLVRKDGSVDVLGISTDVTERKHAEDRLRASEDRYRKLIELSPDAIFVHSDMRIVLVNQAMLRLFRVESAQRLLGREVLELIAPESREDVRVRIAQMYERQVSVPALEVAYLRPDGTRFSAEATAGAFLYAGRPAAQVVVRDITERKLAQQALAESENRFRDFAQASAEWFWETDAQGRISWVSDYLTQHSGLNRERLIGMDRIAWIAQGGDVAAEPLASHAQVFRRHEPFRDFCFLQRWPSGERWVSSSGVPHFGASGEFLGYRGVAMDVTERKRAEENLLYMTRFDLVTGLPNRMQLKEKLDDAIMRSRRRSRGAGVLFIDLDRFKLVNDSLGHQVGDALLTQVGARLRDGVRQDDTPGRLAGDEFAVVIADLARPDDAGIVAQKIVDSFVAPFDIAGHEIFLTASIGIAAFPGDGENADALLRSADAAMYRAKESSRNSFCFYTAEMNARTVAKLQLSNDLRRAVERQEFRLHYQPKVDLATGELTGMEALLRWQHPEKGMISPLDFIPTLEDTGLILAVGDWVLEEACRQMCEWTREGLAPVPIAVNLSARQFRRHDLDAVIRGIVQAKGLQAGMLELEITESSLMEDPVDAIRQLHALRAAGLRISVDDFGTGYSSLSYLTRLPLSTLKIDRSFVNAAITDPNSAAIVRMVIDMAQNLRFDVVAEGVETDQHVAFLRQHGCRQGQGYFLGRPAPAKDVAARLSRR